MSRRDHVLIWGAYAALVVLAVGLRVLTVDRFLPLLDYSDESNMFLLSLYLRGEGAPLAAEYGAALTGEWLAGYPPLYAWLGLWGQQWLEAMSTTFLYPGDYIGAMRRLSVLANALTVVVLLGLGWNVVRPTRTFVCRSCRVVYCAALCGNCQHCRCGQPCHPRLADSAGMWIDTAGRGFGPSPATNHCGWWSACWVRSLPFI